MKPKPIRILLVDDHFMVRLGLAGALAGEPDLEVVGEASSGAEALACFDKLQPDITLMDGILPDIHGIEVTRKILARYPAARILHVSINDTAEDIHQALEAGARGYIPKSSEKCMIVEAIRSVANGNHFLPPELARRLEERGLRPLLSTREAEVLHLIARGFANKQIAAELGLGETTVKTHVAHLLEKLGVSDRTRAVTLAIERGILRI
ncbi:MAG: DNA-binding response regulator [Verrucomicrobia bacterium]|nr:MAG: DNA-binding response regulator [Verrucomicrobiota bacterium]TAE89300.1 MAG: DNA-binding response regulator [Verrucomicrobiota bacterium]TAF27826.1 MAG: DNA-binding response regulator [Verrucomicrobiota bacterium]TAF42675.1 MAG: DNA-binding response regulator [Verrucomicrobiota bacterium]